jgi:signal transduction histidine kinase
MQRQLPKRIVGGVGLVGIGSGLTLSYAFVILFFHNPLVLGVLVPALMALTVVAVAVWLWRKDTGDGRLYHVGVWCSTVTLFAAALGMVNIYSEWMVGGTVQSGMIMIANSASLGALLGLVIGFYDIDREQEHQRVQDKQAEIESLNERLTVLNRVLRHDIRNDVNLVEGYVDMADTDRLPTTEAHQMIRNKAREIADLSHRARKVEELLHGESTEESIELTSVIDDEVAELHEGHPDDIDVSLDVPDEAIVVGNELLNSVVDNLLENAVEHTDRSPVEIRVSVYDTGDGFEMTVIDNGPGLPEHERRIFTQGEESQLQHSSGMGLWLVNWIVPEFGGTIHLGKEGSAGTCIRVWLPKPDSVQRESDESFTASRGGGTPTLTRPTGEIKSMITSLKPF